TANVDSLVETQELQCLIIGLTSLWDQTSSSWRHQASRVVKAVSAVASDNTVPSLQGKNCMRICIQNLLHISSDVTGPMLAEVAVAVFSFIRDSYQVNPALFVEFDNNDGYKALENILKRCEEGVALDQFQPVEELLALIASFTLLGKAELKVAVCVTNPQPPGFKFDPLLTKGVTVKNLSAFQLLQACLLRSGDSLLCCQLLQTLHGIWERDPINFFLLEWTAQPLTQLAACLWRKPRPVQKLFFSLFEMLDNVFVVIQPDLTSHLMHLRIFLRDGIVAEVLSDSGLLKMLFGELRKRAKILRKAGVASSAKTGMSRLIHCFDNVCMCFLVSLRDLGMVPYIKIFLDVDQFRGPTLRILEQLAEINPEEFMSTAIGALCSSTQQELRLKQDLLQSILKVLESPNNWDAFRKAGGFTGLLSLIIDMEGALSDPPREETWKSLGYQPLVNLLLLTLHILALANHLHSVNAHYFEVGGFYERLAEALLQLGCFQPVETEKWSAEEMWPCSNLTGNKQCPGLSFHQLVELAEQPETPTSPSIQLQFHLPIALKTLSSLVHIGSGSPPIEDKEGSSPSSLTSCTMSQDRFVNNTILHSGAVRVFMTLLPSVFTPEDSQLSMEVQFSLAHHLQVMIKSERNRQIMCEGGLVSTILTNCQDVLLTPNHPLHLPITCILEKLSSQSITRADFRKFLCLGNPLMCLAEKTTEQRKRQSDPSSLKDESTDGDDRSSRKAHTQKCTLLQSPAIPVHQIIGLVSMTSPRNFKPHRLSSSPAFVEFDMSESGYGCLFLPTLATVQGVAADSISTGGIGGNCRSFPPTAGLSFSCWFQIDKFSSACDSHPIRLFSVVRHMSRTEQQYVCLSITFSSYDGCLVVSTDETAFTYLDMMEPEVSTPTSLPTSLRFHCSSMLVPGQWHHVVVVMTKDVKKSCLTSAYFNGKVVSTGKMKYIQPFPGQYVSMDPTAVIDVFGVIGTPALWKERVSLVWRVGPSYLFEEPLSPEAVCVIYIQGTAYLGNFLALRLEPDAESVPLRLVPEERISFGINPSISSMTTVAQIREKYNEVDCRLIAKEMGIPSRDNSAPVFLAKNVSQHLNGTARTIGAALIGQFGVRTFTPHMASNGFLYVGGPAVVLSLVAMATDDGSLYAAVKVLLSVLETNTVMQQEMNRISGYKLLAILLKSKSSLISPRTLQLVLHLSCSLELGCSSLLKHIFFALLLFQMWKNTVGNLDLSVLKHLAEILKCDAATMRSLDLMPKLLFELCDPAVTLIIRFQTLNHLILLFFLLIRIGLFLLYTLPPSTNTTESTEMCGGSHDSTAHSGPASFIWIRNQLLLVISLDSLGSDWFLHFLQPHLHPSTLKMGLILLTHFLSSPTRQICFKDQLICYCHGLLSDNLRPHVSSFECFSITCPGFDVLRELLIGLAHLPQLYEALATLLLGKKASHTSEIFSFFSSTQQNSSSDGSQELQISASVMQFFSLLHNLCPRNPLWRSASFLHALADVVYPELKFYLYLFIWQFSPDSASLEQKRHFQKRMLELIMNIIQMLSVDNENHTHLISKGTQRNTNTHILWHTYSLTYWIKVHIRPKQMTKTSDFCFQSLEKGQTQKEMILSELFTSTNKVLLFFLSQPRRTREEKDVVIRTLRTFMDCWDIVMATYNSNMNFIICLLHCLLQISSDEVELKSLAKECWTRVLSERQRMLEENSKMEISASHSSDIKPVCMTELSPLWEEMAHKTWLLYTGQISPHWSLQKVKLSEMMCVVMVSGLRVTEALLLFGKESLFLCEGFTLSPNEDVCCRKHHPSRYNCLKNISAEGHMFFKLKNSHFLSLIQMLFAERSLCFYHCKDNAIELFVKSGHSAFLVFLNKDHMGEISNFEYLMHLNTIAGRTYNDLMQYPVFPWVLADYQSEVLDLSNPSSFRDLSKPMGAQTEKRKQMFIQRYEEMKDCDDEDLSAQCHYCTHYSSAIIVASFLVRMMPFSHTFQALQGGLDIAERLFYSVAKEWESASRDYMGDVRELIPEFFYLPDFLQNSNNINLGCREDGTVLGDVELPPWAKGDPQEFIRVHREALESDHVSSTIHLWIDLIFGFRQQGPAAVECVNTFHPYFFAQHGRRDTRDPVVKNTIRGYINNFGQVPKQLFTKPHPPRYSSTRSGSLPSQPVPFFFDLDKMRTTQHPFRGPVGEIVCLEKEVVVLERNRLLLSPQLGWFFSWGFPDNSCGFGNLSTEKTFAISENLCDWGETLCAACPNPSTIITAGTNTVVCVWDVLITKDKIPHIRLKQPLYGHTDAVTCLAVSEVHGIIVSGSSDLTCILWDMEDLSYITQLAGHETSISALAINDLTVSGEVVSCAGPLMYLWTSKGQLLAHTDTSCGPQSDILCVRFTQRHEWDARNVIVSGCADGVIRIWRTEYTRTQLPGPPEEPVSPGQERTERDGNVRVGSACEELYLKQCLLSAWLADRNKTPAEAVGKKQDIMFNI
uniref:WDFY family member 4 n=1 Tax=Gouania willdenowi TaxID=441366 RepID=A0A8C5H2Y5_GOUWI